MENKSYKIIREYPSSPKLGTIVEFTSFPFDINKEKGTYQYIESETSGVTVKVGINFNPKDHPEYWEEIIEKDYKILSFYDDFNSYIRLSNGNFSINLQYEYTEKELLDKKDVKIHAIKRLSDGEVFSVGDKIKVCLGKYSDKYDKYIVGFKIINNEINISLNPIKDDTIRTCGVMLTFATKIKPLFTTEDGVDIYKGDSYCKVNGHSDYSMVTGFVAEGNHHAYKGLRFSTEEAAEEYIIMNKPCLSINELLSNSNPISNYFKDKLKQLVKSKLNVYKTT